MKNVSIPKLFFVLVILLLNVSIFYSCNTHKEKDKILRYYQRITAWTATDNYRQNYKIYDSLLVNYRRIAKECGFESDDHATRIVGAHYENDSDVSEARLEWINTKKRIDSEIVMIKGDTIKNIR